MLCSNPRRRRHAPFTLSLRAIAVAAALVALAPQHAGAQAPAAPVAAPPVQNSAQDLEQLVGPIALYPDDLVAIILPASTNPVQIVQVDRFLDQRKSNPKLELNPAWDDAVKTLANYPDVVKMMSRDLDWTTALGEAVVADTGEVMEAVQAFRRRAQSAGNLKSDDKTKVTVEQETITIVQADPQVIYVPQYNPQTVVVAGGYPAYSYYPSPYPVYYYPYAPGAALATGIIWGAAMGAIWGGGHYVNHYGGGGNNNINIDRSRNTNINTGDRNIGSGNRGGNTATQWNSGKKPGDVSRTTGNTAQNRVGDRQAGGGGNYQNRQGGAGGAGGGVQNRQAGGGNVGGGTGAGGVQNRAGGAGVQDRSSTQQMGNRGGAFEGSQGSARQTQLDSQRGAASRGNAGAGASRPAPSSRPAGGGGGGARAGGGGGGARGGGGRGGGGGRR